MYIVNFVKCEANNGKPQNPTSFLEIQVNIHITPETLRSSHVNTIWWCSADIIIAFPDDKQFGKSDKFLNCVNKKWEES